MHLSLERRARLLFVERFQKRVRFIVANARAVEAVRQ
jgi:hypothetical protein